MNKFLTILATACLVAGASADTSLRNHIQAKYSAIAKAMIVSVDKALELNERILTSDFVWVDLGRNEYAVEPYMGSQSKMAAQIAKVYSATNTIIAYQEEGLYVRCRTKSTLGYRRQGFSNDRHLMTAISDDVWVKTIHGWKMLRTTSIRENDTIARRGVSSQSAAVMTARMTSDGVVQPAPALALPSSSIVR